MFLKIKPANRKLKYRKHILKKSLSKDPKDSPY